jgi:hypothetical protein
MANTPCNLTEKQKRNFWRKVKKTAGCWEWQAAKANGYGLVGLNGRTYSAHRLSLAMAQGKDIPTEVGVYHRCDNPPCVRPDHLFTGTAADNVADKVRKGRHPAGSRSVLATIDEETVVEIRSLYVGSNLSHSDIASRYGMPRRTITAIINGENWQHVSEPTVHNDPRRKPTTKLTPAQVVTIRKLYATGDYSSRQLGKMYSVAKSTVLRIVNFKLWRNLK